MTALDDVTSGAGAAAPAPERIEPRANIALALAIVGCLTGTIVPAIAALPIAGVAERRIWASDGRLGGVNRITWARRLAQLGIAIGIVAFLAALIITQRSGLSNLQTTFFSGQHFGHDFGEIASAFWINIQVFMIAEVLVLAWALVLAVFRSLPGRAALPLRWFAIVYIDVFRGLPALITVYMIGFGISLADLPIAKNWSDITYGIIALTIVYGAYVAEVYRAGIESVHWSQVAAARSLGLSYGQSMQYVIVPQAIRRIIPPLLNDFISVQKDTVFLSILGTIEAFKQAQILANNESSLTAITTLGLIFLIFTIPLTRLTDYLLKREQRRTQAG
jgi:polar amino acid transport system permease protein